MPDDHHLKSHHFDLLLRGSVSSKRLLSRFFRHLLATCPSCEEEWQKYRDSKGPNRDKEADGLEGSAIDASSSGSSGGDPVDRVLRRLPRMMQEVERERLQAKELLDELLSLPDMHDRVARLRRSRRFRSWSLCELLFKESRRLSFQRPTDGETFAELAIETAWNLEGGRYSTAMISDLLARGWAHLANARRMGSDLVRAEETMLMAYFFIEQGTGDPLVHAEVLSLEASLRRDQRLFTEALRLLAGAVKIYSSSEESHLQGRTLLQVGMIRDDMDQTESAIETLHQGLAMIDRERDPRLHLCFRHTLIFFVNQVGRSDQAAAMLDEDRPLYREFGDSWTLLRERWLEGYIAQGRGQAQEAEAAFREVRQGFLDQGLGYDAALASLNLATTLFEAGKLGEIKILAGEMLPIFESRDVHREAIAALILFQKAAQMETLTLELLRSFTRYLEQARNDARMRFEFPS
jgi:tetratricopeptide (TPR) repeat protein